MDYLTYFKNQKDFKVMTDPDTQLSVIHYLHAGIDWSKPYYLWGRGLVVDKEGNIVGRPYEKFFNYNELINQEYSDKIINLCKWDSGQPYIVLNKVDGSLCTLFNHQKHWYTASSSSVTNPFTKRFNHYLRNHVDLEQVLVGLEKYTIELEYVSPQTQVVIPYPQEKMYVHGVIETKTNKQMPFKFVKEVARKINLSTVKSYGVLSLGRLTDLQKSMIGIEGFVVKFADGRRLKLKTQDYFQNAHNNTLLWGPINTKNKVKKFIEAVLEDEYDDIWAMYNNALSPNVTKGKILEYIYERTSTIINQASRMEASFNVSKDHKKWALTHSKAEMTLAHLNKLSQQRKIEVLLKLIMPNVNTIWLNQPRED